MTPTRAYVDYLDDILDAVDKVEQFTRGMDFEQFVSDARTNFAVIRALEVIGEAVKNIPHATRERYPDIPWREMARIRDKLIHDYFGVDLRVVWRTVQEDVPPLRAQIARVVSDLSAGTSGGTE